MAENTPVVVKTLAEFEAILAENDKVAVDFTASWCPPCKQIAPKFAEFANEHPNIKFIKIDVEENNETAEKSNIQAMPTFHFYHKKEQKVSALTGANVKSLKAKLEELDAL